VTSSTPREFAELLRHDRSQNCGLTRDRPDLATLTKCRSVRAARRA
jgi:hypothetical protein